MSNSVAHIEINVSNLERSGLFYEKILEPLKWRKFDVGHPSVIGFEAPDKSHLFLVQTEKNFLKNIFHRKNTGLNHLAFKVSSRELVDEYSIFLEEERIVALYEGKPKEYTSDYAKAYYAVFLEDPDRIKIEIVYLG